MRNIRTRREFMAAASAFGVGLIAAGTVHAEDGSPETVSVRLTKIPGICIAPQYMADELLAAEGITDVSYVETGAGGPAALAVARGEIDFGLNFVASLLLPMDAGENLMLLAGVHSGCFELFAREGIDGITDLRGKRVGLQALGSAYHLFLASMAAHVGLDPAKDINWVANPDAKPKELFAEGKIDAFLGFPPDPQDLRSRHIGRVIVNSSLDQPWSQYFCCMLVGNRDFVRQNPAATKRVVRAILKATDLCVTAPAMVARRMVDDGFTNRYDLALQALQEVPYYNWREYDPEDTIRFYALRLHEAGMITSDPNRLVAEATDWRFLDQIRRELKA